MLSISLQKRWNLSTWYLALTYCSSAHIVYIFLSFPTLCMTLNILLDSFLCLFTIAYNSRSCLVCLFPILFLLLLWIAFFHPYPPTSPPLFITVILWYCDTTTTTSFYLFIPNTIFVLWKRHFFFSHCMNISMGTMKYAQTKQTPTKNNKSQNQAKQKQTKKINKTTNDQQIMKKTQQVSLINFYAWKQNPTEQSPQVQNRDHHWHTCHLPPWKSSEKHTLFVDRVSRKI